MSTLKEQLSKLGLVDEKDSDNRGSFNKAMKDAPKNRLGKPMIWYKWLVRKRLPSNMSGRCCMCGQYRKSCETLERTDEAKRVERRLKKLKPKPLAVCGLCDEEE